MTESTLLVEHNNGITSLTLNRPDQANGMNAQFGVDLLNAVHAIRDDASIRAVIITGKGRFFSAGGDLKAFSDYDDRISEEIQKLADALHEAQSILARINAPVIVAVNGAAAGAGFGLSLCGDYIIAGQSASWTMAYTAAGLSPDGGATFLLPRLIGLRKTQELALTNRKVSPDEALDWGMVNEVVADDELLEKAQQLASRFAKGPTAAFGVVKRLLVDTWTNSYEEQMNIEARELAGRAASPDGQEGIHAFLEKRKPEFTGK